MDWESLEREVQDLKRVLQRLEGAAVDAAERCRELRADVMDPRAAVGELRRDLSDLRREMAEQGRGLRREISGLGQGLRIEMSELGRGLRVESHDLSQALRGESHDLGQSLRRELRALREARESDLAQRPVPADAPPAAWSVAWRLNPLLAATQVPGEMGSPAPPLVGPPRTHPARSGSADPGLAATDPVVDAWLALMSRRLAAEVTRNQREQGTQWLALLEARREARTAMATRRLRWWIGLYLVLLPLVAIAGILLGLWLGHSHGFGDSSS